MMALDTVRYDAALIDGPDYREGHVHDRRNKLTLTDLRKLRQGTPTEKGKWIVVGWSNPLAPKDWKDE